MEAAKRQEIENRLGKLIAQAADQAKKEEPPTRFLSSGASVIRRRKGKAAPDPAAE